MRTSEPQSKTGTGLSEIAWLSSQDKAQTFHSLMHHINIGSLRGCYHKLDGKKAIGADRISKEMYGDKLQENLEGLMVLWIQTRKRSPRCDKSTEQLPV